MAEKMCLRYLRGAIFHNCKHTEGEREREGEAYLLNIIQCACELWMAL